MNPKCAILFSGGGSHYVGMGKFFYDHHAVFRETMQEASDQLRMNLNKLCFEGDALALSSMTASQVAIFTVGVGMFRTLQSMHNLSVDAMAGHSLGEYCALTCAGALSFKDGLKAVQKRGELLHRSGLAHTGRMMVVNGVEYGVCQEVLVRLKKENAAAYLSNVNSPRQIVLSGNATGIAKAETLMREAGGDVHVLSIPTCSHCILMDDYREEFATFLEDLVIRPLATPVYSNLTGEKYADEFQIRRSLTDHLVQPVLWEKTVRSMLEENIHWMIECGPQGILKGLKQFIDHDIAALSFDDAGDRTLLAQYMRSLTVDPLVDDTDRLITAVLCEPNMGTSEELSIQRIHDALQQMEGMKEALLGDAIRGGDICESVKALALKVSEEKGVASKYKDRLLNTNGFMNG